MKEGFCRANKKGRYMRNSKKTEIIEEILDENTYKEVKSNMKKRGFLVVEGIGTPSVGKTSLLKKIILEIEKIAEANEVTNFKSYVVECDPESDIEYKEFVEMGVESFHIKDYGEDYLDVPTIEEAIPRMPFKERGIVFLENQTDIENPQKLAIGKYISVIISTLSEGSDKPLKYLEAYKNADMVIMNRIDLATFVNFDEQFYMKMFRTINRDAPVFKASAITGEGVTEIAQWLYDKYLEVANK